MKNNIEDTNIMHKQSQLANANIMHHPSQLTDTMTTASAFNSRMISDVISTTININIDTCLGTKSYDRIELLIELKELLSKYKHILNATQTNELSDATINHIKFI